MRKVAIFASAGRLKDKPQSLSIQIESCRKAATDAGYLVSEEFTNVDALLQASTDKAQDFQMVYICYPDCSLLNSEKLPKIAKQLERNGKKIMIIFNPEFERHVLHLYKTLADENTPSKNGSNMR